MAGAAGYAVLPTTISLSGINKELQSQLLAPASKAAKKAGDSIEKGITKGTDDAAKRVEKANYRVKKSSEELADAEAKRNSEVLKSQAAAKQLEAAESKLADMKKSGKASSEQLAKAEADVLNKRAKVETAAQNVEKAERGVEKAMAESKRASDSLAAAQKDLENATDEATSATKEFGDAAADADGKGQGFEVSLGKIAAAGAVVVGAVGAAGKAAYDIGAQFDDAYDTIRAGTGASGAAFEELQDSMRKVAGESIGVGSDMGAIGSTLADLNTRLGLTGEPLEEMTAQFMQLQNLGVDADINEVSKAMSGFGIEAKDMPGALDELFQVSQATGLTISELSQSAVKAGPVLRGFGFSMSDSAALVGQMDKAGLDADKTLQSMQRALAEFASEGRDAPEALKETIGSIEDLISAGDDAAAIDMASGIFGSRGAAQFVDAVKTGTLSVDDFMDATGATSDTIGGLAEETADFGEKWDQLKNQAMLALEPIATQVFDSLVPALDRAQGAFEFTLDAVKDFAEWVQKSKDWLLPLGAGLTVVAGGLAAVAFQQKIIAAGGLIKWFKSLSSVTKLMTGVQAAFNMVMAANPIALVTIAIAGLVAGLVAFFTKTETGREMWASFTTAIGEGWTWLTETLSAGWEWLKSAVFDSWNATVEGVQDGWQATVDAVTGGWTWLKDTFVAVWETIKTVVFWAWNREVEGWKNIFESAKNGINAAWDAIKGKASEAVGAVRGKIQEMVNTIAQVPGKVKSAFADAGTWLVNAGKNIISGLINGIKSMFGQVGNAIREVMPDGVARFVPGIATGGQVPGYARGGYIHAIPGIPDSQRDPIFGIDSAGVPVARIEPREYVVNREATKDNLPLLQDINSGRISMKDLPGYADGGVVSSQEVLDFAWGKSVRGKKGPAPLEGYPYTWGGGLLGNWGDCSGMISGLAAFIVGMDIVGRKFATGNEGSVLSSMGFTPGTSPGKSAFEVGFFNGGPYGGHTSGTIYEASGKATNVEMGGGRGNGQIGGAAAGARHSQYTDRFWIPLQDKPPEPPKMNEILPMAATGEIDASLVTGGTSAPGTSTETVKLSPQEAAIATAADELGDQSVVEHLTAGLLDMAGLSDGLLEKALLGKPSDWLPSGDSIITEKQVQVPTSSRREEPTEPVDKTVAPAVITPAEEEKLKGPDWGPEFFAGEIARKAKDMGLDKLAAKIGIATALVESGDPLKMWANRAVPESLNFRHDAIGSDYDSVGLFQQRDNGAWGTVKERMTPFDSAGMFFDKLKGFDYRSMDPGAAAQKVQVSAFPSRYGQQMGAAESLLDKVGVFDQGGWLKPGGIAVNLSNEPEPVFNGDQWRDIKRGGLNGEDGVTVVVNLDGQEVLRKRVDAVEGRVEINERDLADFKNRRPAMAVTTRGGAF
ncbi:laminin subunit gamma-1 [Corynebacterium imitans]|uniref:Laminin subunit gamma-1 n=1 Tax=Corynebacterium imitans TaxID=156978 RepID=A0A239ZHT3_9CORY|nr:phage tail tape measure protein [Corynebacterium imitans]SNV70802.1 laminin subunit gamma-1 [Corynebacterium imitans]